MKIIVETLNGATIEIDLEGQTLKASIPVVDVLGEIRVVDGTPPIVHLTLPFGQVEAVVPAAAVKAK